MPGEEKSSSLLPFVYSDVFLVGVPAAIKKQLSRQVAFMQKKKQKKVFFPAICDCYCIVWKRNCVFPNSKVVVIHNDDTLAQSVDSVPFRIYTRDTVVAIN